MNTRKVAFAAAAALMLAAPAVAGTRTPMQMQRCNAVQQKFDQVILRQGSSPDAEQTKMLRREAETRCRMDRPRHGAESTRTALPHVGGMSDQM